MSGTSLAVIEQQLEPLVPMLTDVLRGSGLEPARLIRTVMICLDRTPKLLECTSSSIMQCAVTAGVLQLEADGATGQFFMLPFGGKAQPCIGYKGYNTIAARSGFSINGGVVREGDTFDYAEGSDPFVTHKQLLGGPPNRRIVAAWATASRPDFTPLVKVLDLEELEYTKKKSPSGSKADSPWMDPIRGVPAMYEKTAKRRLARGMPLNTMVRAAAMEEAYEERGKHAYLHPDKGLVIDGEVQQIGAPQPAPKTAPVEILQRRKFTIYRKRENISCNTIDEWRGRFLAGIEKLPVESVEDLRERNGIVLDELHDEFPAAVADIVNAFKVRLGK
jgi:phage RecT family recombinase